MIHYLKRIYVLLILLAISASIFSYFKSKISSPVFPALLTSKFLEIDPRILLSSQKSDYSNSDRMLSEMIRYTLRDGSELFAVMVRVRKRDDFKIETYGLLTKGVDQLYIKSPLFSNSVPYSMIGLIGGVKTIQTCVIPGTTRLDQVNVQLFPLLFQADRLAGSSQSIFSKLLGTDDRSDYSCLILSYKPKSSLELAQNTWKTIIKSAQSAMSVQSDLR